MIYCIGKTSIYEKLLNKRKVVRKLGRNRRYCGGSVWKKRSQAKEHCPADYSVYGVIAHWENDTVKSKDGPWHDLIKTSKIVRI